MSNYIKVLKRQFSNRKYLWILLGIISKITFKRIELRAEKVVQNRKVYFSNKIAKKYSNKVLYGPFQGMKISDKQFWKDGNKGSKILGLYEKEIQDLLQKIQFIKKRSLFIDIGGADGFYSTGSLINGLFNRCLVFEESARGRRSILNNAKLNKVENKIEIKSTTSDKALLKNIDLFQDSVILCDIEGAEFELFTEKVLYSLCKNEIIIEVHKLFGSKNWKDLFKVSSKYFDIKIIYPAPRNLIDLSIFSDISGYSDNDRALLISEGGSNSSEWWHLSPKKGT